MKESMSDCESNPLTVCLISAGLASRPCFSRIVREAKKRIYYYLTDMISWL